VRFHPRPPPLRPTRFVSLEREIQSRGAIGPLTKLKNDGKHTDIARHVRTLSKNPGVAQWIVAHPFPKTLAELQSAPLLKYRTLSTELYWNACVLRLFSKELNSFVQRRSEFSEAILGTDYSAANEILASIERDFGYSIWLIENRIGLFAAANGLEKQKEFSRTIVRNSEIKSSVRLLARYFSVRAEQTVAPPRFSKILNDFLQGFSGLGTATAQYYRFKLDFFGGHEFIHFLPQILLLESNAAIIDRYLTFVRACQLVVAAHPNTRSLRAVTDALSVLRDGCTDPLLFNLCSILGITSPVVDQAIPHAIHSLVEQYTVGDYLRCAQSAETFLAAHPSSIEVNEIYAKATIRLGSEYLSKLVSSRADLVNRLRSILLLDRTAPVSVNELLKLATVNQSHSWAAQIYSFLMQEYRHDRRAMAERMIIFGELNSYPGNPRLFVFVRRASFPAIYSAHVESRKLSPRAHRLMDILSNSRQIHPDALTELGLPEPRLHKYQAKLLHDRGEYDVALALYTKLLSETGSVTYYDNLLPAVACLISAGLLKDAVRLTIAAYLRNRNVAARLPIVELIEQVEMTAVHQLPSLIELPILYDLYYRTYGSKELERADACEDFLKFQGVQRPSQLKTKAQAFDPAALMYFLRLVCVPEVLDSSVEFQSTEDVQQERIAVLQFLREVDAEHADEYSNEIRALTTSLTVARGLREVEQSRIYVDVRGVKRTVENILKDSYLRYIDLVKHTPVFFDPSALILAVSRVDEADGGSVSVYLPVDEAFALFKSMVVDIRDKFVSSNEYGLDSSLSMGFRHGTLSGQLRPQLEAAHLLTLKDSKTNEYRRNEYWAKLLAGESSAQAVLERLKQFSADVDGLIDEVNNNVLQIKTETRGSTGLFDFSISDLLAKGLQIRNNPETGFNGFFEATLHELWSRTDNCLETVRTYVSDTLKPKFERLFDSLAQDLTFNRSAPLKPIFDMVIQAKIDTQYNLDRIRSWFARTTADETADYQPSLLIEIGLETIHNVYLEQPIKPVLQVDESLRFKGKTLSAMTNIMFMLFDNIRKYAALHDSVRGFTCDIRKQQKDIVFTITNTLPAETDPTAEDNRLAEIRAAIQSALAEGRIAGDNVKREGRSGFYKIAKLLLFDLGGVANLEFGFDQNRNFGVQFSIPAGVLLA
jgi:hypothetical protein